MEPESHRETTGSERPLHPGRPSRVGRWGVRAAICCVAGIAAVWGFLLLTVPSESDFSLAALPSRAIAADPTRFPQQGRNECGAYALALGLAVLNGEAPAPRALVEEVFLDVPWSETLSGSPPWRVTGAAAERGFSNRAFTCASNPAPQRLARIRHHLAALRPVILLIESPRKEQHYVLVLGYDEDRFFLYDPNLGPASDDTQRTEDHNGPAPGNLTWPEAVLLEHWERGGALGLYEGWYFPLQAAH